MFEKRESGVLVHPTSFPSAFGIGDLGKGAYEFIDFLKLANQKLWQILPLGPTGYGDSPYQSFSSFAGNPYLISPELLVKEGYLESCGPLNSNERKIDYGTAIEFKMGLLKKAFKSFNPSSAFTKFCNENKLWLDDYALFSAIKSENDNKPWSMWPNDIANREPNAIKRAKEALSEKIGFYKFIQYEFFRQWGLLKSYANKHDIRIIGDIPIFVAMDSADVWANPELYQLDKDNIPTAVAGVPPDYFSETGQLWGNPLYKWEEHKKTDYDWWCRRIQAVLQMVDMIRIDHFRGFESYWATPYGEKTAENGKWVKGPGKPFFTALEKRLGSLPIIAEDLGIITEKVNKLRTGLNLPGMKVLQFAFNPEDKSLYLPHMFSDSLTVAYSGTHDNNTTIGWYKEAKAVEKDYIRRYMNISGDDIAWDMIRLAFSTSAIMAIVPIQDILSLDEHDRMNQPSIPDGQWQFRYTSDMLKEEYAEKLKYLSELFHRNG